MKNSKRITIAFHTKKRLYHLPMETLRKFAPDFLVQWYAPMDSEEPTYRKAAFLARSSHNKSAR